MVQQALSKGLMEKLSPMKPNEYMRNLKWPSGKTLWLQKQKFSSSSASFNNDYIVTKYQNQTKSNSSSSRKNASSEFIIERGILLSNTMITDHLIGNYENALWETLLVE